MCGQEICNSCKLANQLSQPHDEYSGYNNRPPAKKGGSKDHLSIVTTVGWSKDHLLIETTVGWFKDHLLIESTVGWFKDHLLIESTVGWSMNHLNYTKQLAN